MNLQNIGDAKRTKSSFQPFLPEMPRMFGANEGEGNEAGEYGSDRDFMARWWPGEMEPSVAPRKPR